jgi:cellulose synthase/poly-beta-1,6-N-acetylglucosamine synthase-like glycosyltransferase
MRLLKLTPGQNHHVPPEKRTSSWSKYKPINLDLWVGAGSVLILLAYIVAYGIIRLHGFVIGRFNEGYLVIIVPIFIVDGVRGILDIAFAKEYKEAEEDLSKVTVVIACKDGEPVIGATLDDLKKKFAPSQIIVASNGSTDKTCEIVRSHDAICLEVVEPIGKVRAINHAMSFVKTPYVLLLDDDTLLNGALIPTGLLDKNYGGVAFRVHVKRHAKNSLATLIQAHEYRKSSDIGKRRHNKHAAVQNISGAVGLYTHKELVRQVELHSGEFSGEDLQRTMLLHLAIDSHYKGVVLAHSIVLTEAPSDFRSLYRQRVFGWFPGQYANFKNYIKVMFSSHAPRGLREDAFYNVFFVMFMDIIRIVALPIMIFYPWYFVVMYVTYVTLETIAYLKNSRQEPYWVVLIYPFYGLFGLVTRLGAFCAFCYRRLIAHLCHMKYYDDYRRASASIKLLSLSLVMILLSSVLIINIKNNYSRTFTNINLAHAAHHIGQMLQHG